MGVYQDLLDNAKTFKPTGDLAAFIQSRLNSKVPAANITASNTAFAAGANAKTVPQWVIRDLAREMAAEDSNNDIYHSVIESLGIDDRARKAQYLGDRSQI